MFFCRLYSSNILSTFSVTENSFDFWYDSGKTFAKSAKSLFWFFCYFEFAERPISKYMLITHAIFLSGSTANGVWVCMFERRKITPFVKIFNVSTSYRGMKVEPLWRVCSIPHSTWLSFVEKCRVNLKRKHRHAKRARVIFFGDRSIHRTVYSNDLVKFFWVAMYSEKETGNL